MKKLSDFNKHKLNPFLHEGVVTKGNKYTRMKRVYSLVNEFGEMVSDDAVVSIRKAVDKALFVKLFTSQMQEMFKLEDRELKVYMWIMTKVKYNTDYFYMDKESCMKELGYTSDNTLRYAIIGLIDKKFIARSSLQHIYFINPAVAFNGDRMQLTYYATEELNDNDTETDPRIEW